ncbi:amidohydrolase family protein [Candidatus Thioglobus sp.]|jgi:predicted TIM-barrel fold metal-dependent hydrolase|nr:amidohydrolase family protein [Candidatus Thioglobus sp.]|tara:strand:+ start:478 stop:1431 length:954 start_codon:yes stop_codon:yes gene_type:complete
MKTSVDKNQLIDIWDSHFHIWDISENTTSGHDAEQLFSPKDNPIYSMKSYSNDIKQAGSNFRHTGGAFCEALSACHVGMEGDEFLSECIAETRYASKELNASSTNNIIISTAPLEDDNIGKILANLAEDPLVRGIRQILNFEPAWPRNKQQGDLLVNPKWQRGYSELKNFSMSWDLQINPNQFHDAARVIEKNPETPVIIGHLGTPTLNDITEKKEDYWNGLKALSELDNVFMKISMLAYTDPEWDANPFIKDTVLQVIDLFGVERCQFASNLPVENLWGWDAKRIFSGFLGIVENQFSYEDQQKLFADNARKVYRA